MSSSVRNLVKLVATELASQHNLLRLDLLRLRDGLVFHADATTAVAVADATADGYGTSSSALANALKTAYAAHRVSDCSSSTGQGCHISADSTNVISAAVATDVASAITLTDDIKAKFNAHIGSAVFHPLADTLNVITLSNNATEAGLVLLVNHMKLKMNAHFASAFVSQAIVLGNP